jgi:hypothetical protein
MAERIRRHRERRPAGWRTVEAPLRPAEAAAQALGDARTVVVEDLTLLLSNVMVGPAHGELPEEGDAIDALAAEQAVDGELQGAVEGEGQPGHVALDRGEQPPAPPLHGQAASGAPGQHAALDRPPPPLGSSFGLAELEEGQGARPEAPAPAANEAQAEPLDTGEEGVTELGGRWLQGRREPHLDANARLGSEAAHLRGDAAHHESPWPSAASSLPSWSGASLRPCSTG